MAKNSEVFYPDNITHVLIYTLWSSLSDVGCEQMLLMHTCKLSPHIKFPAACRQNHLPMPSYLSFKLHCALQYTTVVLAVCCWMACKQRCNRRCVYFWQMKQLRTPDRQIKHIKAKHLVVWVVNRCCVVVVCGGDCRGEPCNLRCTIQQKNNLPDLTINVLFIRKRRNKFSWVYVEKKQNTLVWSFFLLSHPICVCVCMCV